MPHRLGAEVRWTSSGARRHRPKSRGYLSGRADASMTIRKRPWATPGSRATRSGTSSHARASESRRRRGRLVKAFSHLIVTRFNLELFGSCGRDPDWLADRVCLFERFCYPSVRGQTNQEFRWLVLLNAETPREVRDRIGALAEWPPFRPCFLQQHNLEAIQKAIRNNIPDDIEYLMTTTLDNDDALARTFVERLQNAFTRQQFELINFTNGLRLDLNRNRLYRCHIPSNPFISLIERDHDPTTVAGCLPHSTIPSRFESIREIECEPMWLQVIHGRNVAPTGFWGLKRIPLIELERAVSVEGPTSERRESGFAIAVENVRRGVERAAIQGIGRRLSARMRAELQRRRRI